MIKPQPLFITPWQAFWFGFWLDWTFRNMKIRRPDDRVS